jgi:Fe2+ transport system protein A
MGVGFDVTCELTRLADGEAARVVGFAGEADGARLESMGILVGSIVEKKSTALRNGPVVVERGRTQLALAYCIAQGILVEPLR